MANFEKHPASPPGASSSPADVNLETADKEGGSPRTPNERDESSGGVTDGTPSERVKQGSEDLKRGLRDTSRGEATDRAYDKLKK